MASDFRALHFYERMGMRKLREGDFPIGDGYYMNDYIMGLDIKSGRRVAAAVRKIKTDAFVGVRFFAWRPVAGDLARLLAPPGLPESSVAGLLPDAGIRLP